MEIKLDHIYTGDCLEVMKDFPDESFDAVVTDPPFGIGFNYSGKKEKNDNPKDYWKWLKPIYQEMLRVLKPGGFVSIWQTQIYFKHFWEWFGDDIHIYIGAKNFVQIRPKSPIQYGYDPIIIFYKDGERLSPKEQYRSIDFYVANTASFITEKNNGHPCPRPIDQTMILVDNFVIDNGLVLDPFMGSGTTALACEKTNRHYVGIEIDPEYVKISNTRISRVQPKLL